MGVLMRAYLGVFRPHHKEDFLNRMAVGPQVRVLDVGCGNNGVAKVRKYCRRRNCTVFYSGLDIGDYNITEESKNDADEYVLTTPDSFADAILQWEEKEDVVISSHNLEHCNEPFKVINSISRSLKAGGHLYLSFPSEESAGFPKGFQGCLNFYDDLTHQNLLCWEEILSAIRESGMEIEYSCKNYRPRIPRFLGWLTWFYVKRTKRVLPFTWEYFGFESVIWARKK